MKRTSRDIEQSSRRVSRRALLLGTTQIAFMGVLTLRMRYMQIEQADEFRLLAEENRINVRLIPPSRGVIRDRNGIDVAGNAQNYSIVMVREDAGDVDQVLDRLATLIPLDPVELDKRRSEVKRLSAFVPVTIADQMSWQDFSKVSVNAPALPGISPEVGLSRVYPLDDDFAHVVGYVGPVSDYDLTKGYLANDDDPLLQIPKFAVGKVGVEARMEDDLRGKAGLMRIEVNAYGRVMRELTRQEGIPGSDLTLTVDARLQNYVQARMAGESAAGVVIDATNGDVLAIGSAPAFDPNPFVRGISVADYRELTANNHRPLANKSVQGTYPPGSTFKIVTALAALAGGVVRPDETVYCPGYIERAGRRFHCWKHVGHGSMDIVSALMQSCDVFFYTVAERVGIDAIADMGRKLGLGERHDLPMSAVADGLLPTRDWKRARRNEDWLIGDTLNAGIGQGFVLASPLQLALMSARVASGLDLKPRLIKAVNGKEVAHPVPQPLDISAEHLRLVRRGLFNVANNRRGTAYRSRIDDDNHHLAGKTGTSQVFSITAADRARGIIRAEDLPWNRRDHALFVCFAPYEAPTVACSVVVEHGGAEHQAAPMARDMVMQAMWGGNPPIEAYPASERPAAQDLQDKLQLRAFGGTEKVSSRA